MVCPYLMVKSVEKQIEFMQHVFQARLREKETHQQADGFIGHGEVWVGHTVIMMGRASKQFPARQSMNYVYVDDPDVVYARALKVGATAVMEPTDQPYGNRSGGFIDLHGNEWWIARPLKK